MKDLITRLNEAAEQMAKGVHGPGHIAAIKDAVKLLERLGWHSGSEEPEHDGKYLACYHFKSHPPVIHFYGVLDYYLTDPKPHWQHTLGENGPTIDWWMPIPHTPDETED